MAPKRQRIIARVIVDVVLERVCEYEADHRPAFHETVFEYDMVNRLDVERSVQAQMLAAVVDNEDVAGKGTYAPGGTLIAFPQTYRMPKKG